MNENYDVIILGTGIKECILSGLLSVAKKKVLHLDRNDYYGAESASLNLKQLFLKDNEQKNDEKESKIDESILGQSKQYAIDLCPKFLMGCGNLVKMLIRTQVTRYLEFRCINGSFVYKDNKLQEIPITAKAVWDSSLMSMFQKYRYKTFLEWVVGVKENDPKTWKKCDLRKQTMREIYSYWRCDEHTQTLTGHAIALYKDDTYLDDATKTLDCIKRLQMYAYSIFKFEDSPYIYPVWGLGGLPEGFSRLAAVHGGTYMLRREIEDIIYNNKGEVIGVKVKNEGSATCKQLIGDPSYFLNTKKVEKTGTVARWLCILDHPVNGTNNSNSAQIILPCKQTGHRSDIYISVQSSELHVAPKHRWIAMISAQVYTNQPKKELYVAYRLLGRVLKDFFMTNDTYRAINQNENDNVYIPSSMDATTHFEQATKEVMKIYKEITGEDVDLDANVDSINDQY